MEEYNNNNYNTTGYDSTAYNGNAYENNGSYAPNGIPEYVPQEQVQVKKPSAKLKTFAIVALALGVILTLTATVRLIVGVEIAYINTLSYTEIESSEDYYIDKLIVVDVYASTEKNASADSGSEYDFMTEEDFNNAESVYYVVGFFDRDSNLVYASLKVGEYADLFDKCKNYVLDENALIGELTITGCFSVSGEISESSDVYGFFKKAYDVYNTEVAPGKMLNRTFTYEDMETINDYELAAQSKNILVIIGGGVVAIVGAILLIIFIKKNKKAKEESGVYTDNTGEFNADV